MRPWPVVKNLHKKWACFVDVELINALALQIQYETLVQALTSAIVARVGVPSAHGFLLLKCTSLRG